MWSGGFAAVPLYSLCHLFVLTFTVFCRPFKIKKTLFDWMLTPYPWLSKEIIYPLLNKMMTRDHFCCFCEIKAIWRLFFNWMGDDVPYQTWVHRLFSVSHMGGKMGTTAHTVLDVIQTCFCFCFCFLLLLCCASLKDVSCNWGIKICLKSTQAQNET